MPRRTPRGCNNEASRPGEAEELNDIEEKRYLILRIVARVHEVIGWAVVIFGPVIAGLTAVFQADLRNYGWTVYGLSLTLLLIIVAVICIVIGFPIIAFGQLIRVFIDIEAGTRATFEAVGQLRRELRPGGPAKRREGQDLFDLP